MAVGAGVGLVLGTLYIVSYDEGIDDSEEGVMLMVAVTGGILAGLIIGSVVRGTRWEDVSPASLRLGSKGGLDIHLAFGVTP